MDRIGITPDTATATHIFDAKYLTILIMYSICIGLIGAKATTFVTPMPIYWLEAQEFEKTSRIVNIFTPDFYPAMLGEGLRLFGKCGPVLMQLLMYVVFTVLVYCIFCLLDITKGYAALFAGLVSLCPDLITGINKIWDIEASCTVFAAIVCCILLITKKGIRFGRTILIGIVWGVGVAIRPNFPTLALPIVYAIWVSLPRSGNKYAKLLLHFSFAIAIAFGTVASLNRFSHGSFFWPQNGPYNFYAGANEYTSDSLKSTQLNGEISIGPALMKMGVLKTNVELNDVQMNKLYMDNGIAFIRAHPLEWTVKLSVLKFITMLRPDTKIHPIYSPQGLARVLVSIASIMWIILLYDRIRSGWKRVDTITVLLIVSYSLPFLLTNSDPRYGLPLNLFLWTVVISYLYKIKWHNYYSHKRDTVARMNRAN